MTSPSPSHLDNPPEPIWSAEQDDAGRAVFGLRVAPPLLCLMVVVLLSLGMAMIHSATIATQADFYFQRQLMWILISAVVYAVGALVPLRVFYRYSHWGVLLILLPLAYLAFAKVLMHFAGEEILRFFPLISETNGAIRWLEFGPIKIQPSEFSKLFLVIYLAAYYGRLPRNRILDFVPGVLVPGLATGCILALIVLGKDLSTTVITAGMAYALMFLAGIRFRWILLFAVVGSLAIFLFINGSEMRRGRILAFQNPKQYRTAESHQLWRSQLCIGAGGITGRGYANGVMKTYLPEAHTDFIVAVIGEELGLLGLLLVLGAYTTICISIIAIARQCRHREDLLLCLGISVLLALQALVNVGVVSGVVPPTGVTAPFLSYGGSSLISLMFLMGLIMNVSLRNHAEVTSELSRQRLMPTETGLEYLRDMTPR